MSEREVPAKRAPGMLVTLLALTGPFFVGMIAALLATSLEGRVALVSLVGIAGTIGGAMIMRGIVRWANRRDDPRVNAPARLRTPTPDDR